MLSVYILAHLLFYISAIFASDHEIDSPACFCFYVLLALMRIKIKIEIEGGDLNANRFEI